MRETKTELARLQAQADATGEIDAGELSKALAPIDPGFGNRADRRLELARQRKDRRRR